MPKSLVHHSGKNVPANVDLIGKITQMSTARNDGPTMTTDMSTWRLEFSIALYRRQNLLLRVDWIRGPKIPLGDISSSHVIFHAQCFCAYGLDHARGTLSIAIAATANRFEACDGAPPASYRAVNEAP